MKIIALYQLFGIHWCFNMSFMNFTLCTKATFNNYLLTLKLIKMFLCDERKELFFPNFWKSFKIKTLKKLNHITAFIKWNIELGNHSDFHKDKLVAVAEGHGIRQGIEGPGFESRRLQATFDPRLPKNNNWFPARNSVPFKKKICKAHFKRY